MQTTSDKNVDIALVVVCRQIFLSDAHPLLRSLFCTRMEERFTRAQIEPMLMHAGFEQIRFSDLPLYWGAVGLKSSRGCPD